MISLDTTAIDFSTRLTPPADAFALNEQPVATVTLTRAIEAPSQTRLDEPSSLALTLIGVATLAAYRGIQKRVIAQLAPARTTPRLVKPRRRAA